MSPTPPEPARRLLLELARGEARARRCPSCAGPLVTGELELREMELDRAVVEVTCRRCRARVRMVLRPDASGSGTVGP
ncbi:MAG TPA: hypothetical protein VKY90_11700 [Candidatus Dormibacteraeota bacterium]|nr:hypothetical protein [Candidatus Dormibacteraeota bacterium]